MFNLEEFYWSTKIFDKAQRATKYVYLPFGEEAGISLRNLTVISKISAFSNLE